MKKAYLRQLVPQWATRGTHKSLMNLTNWVCLITARIRRMGEGTVFSLFVSPHLRGGGYPISGLGGGGVYPISGLGRGYPIPGLAGGVPHPRSGQGGTPSQVCSGGTPWDGVPPDLRWATPQTWDGVPPPDLGWGTPCQVWGVPPGTWDRVPPPNLGRGTPPKPGMGYPPDLGWGNPPGPGTGYPPSNIASTCYGYAAGGMPLAFTQEDFLVFDLSLVLEITMHVENRCASVMSITASVTTLSTCLTFSQRRS